MMNVLYRNSCRLLMLTLALLLAVPSFADKHNKKKEEPKPISIYDVDSLINPIPRQRQLWHDYFHKALRGADASDGKVDGYIWYGDDTMASNAITQALLHKAAHLDTMIENLPVSDPQRDNQEKIRYLRAVTNMVNAYNHDTKADPYFYRKVVNNIHDMIIARHEGKLDAFVRANENEYSLANVELLDGHPDLRALLYKKVGLEQPLKMIKRLQEYAHEPFACAIIAAAARKAPTEIYNYASSTNITLNGAIRRCNDPLVQAIVRITSESKNPLKAMSFISDIYNKRLSIAEVDKITSDDISLFKNLVRLQMQGDTLGGTSYTQELSYRANSIFISRINELHESPDPVRFKILDGLSPEELYYIIVYGQDRIYTSSFIGAFRRMMERLKPNPGDVLLDKTRFVHFRTFIRMCAGYNTLSDFLSTMKPEEKTAVMKEFISGLEQGKTDDLEDAVDVADAFGSIKDTALADFLRQEIINNYTRVSEARNLKGTIVYGLLATLANGSNNDSLAQNLHLPPISNIPFKSLVNDSGIVYEQFFFYGDEDGRSSYASFLTNFTDKKKWTRPEENPTKQWVTIKSISGKPIVIFANLPLDYETDQDDAAQKALEAYLNAHDIHPTFLVHRGHSYHLSSTVDYMSKSNRIIMLGSCGGYHNLGAVLDHAPDAHLISTKQTGTMLVNDAIIKALNEHLLAGDDIDWVKLWAEIGQSLKGKEKDFNEYVPPYRNLGAIFIKAYRRIFNEADLAGS